MPGYTCQMCGRYHHELPLSYGAPSPASWYAVPERERRRRAVLGSDNCIIDNEFFFVLGNLEIPIIDAEQIFAWSVWISLSRANYERATALWNTAGREAEPPYFGWLNTALPGYPSTLNLKTNLHTRPVGQRPYILLEPTDHPLAVEQRNGVTWEWVQRIAEKMLHPTG